MNFQLRWLLYECKKFHIITDENAFLLLIGDLCESSFQNGYLADAEASLVAALPVAPIFLVHNRSTSCVVQVNCGKIQPKNILRSQAEAEVAVVGHVEGAMAQLTPFF